MAEPSYYTKTSISNIENDISKSIKETHEDVAEIIRLIKTHENVTEEKVEELRRELERSNSLNKSLNSELSNYKTLVEKLQQELDKANKIYDQDTKDLESKMDLVLKELNEKHEEEIKDYKQELFRTERSYKDLINSLYNIFTSGIISDAQDDDLEVRDYDIIEAIEDKVKKHPRIFNKYFRIFGYGSNHKQGFVDNGIYTGEDY